MTSLFNLGMNLIAVLVFIFAFGVTPTWTWLLFPVVVLVLFVFTSAVSMLLSSLYVRYRDVAIIWSVAATALFYGTPVLYPLDIVPSQNLIHILFINPLTPLFEQARKWIIDPDAPGAAERRRRLGVPDRADRHLSSWSASWPSGSSTARRRGSPRSCERARHAVT